MSAANVLEEPPIPSACSTARKLSSLSYAVFQKVNCKQMTPSLRSLILLTALALPAAAQQITHSPAAIQSGSPILFSLTLPEATAVTGTWQSHPVSFARLTPTGPWLLLAGVDVEAAPGTYPLSVTAELPAHQQSHLSTQITVGKATYRTSKITVAAKFLAPDPATQARITEEKALKDAAFATDTPEILWSGPFTPPVPLSSTDTFGTRRTFNGTLASVHRGTDFRATAGTPVYAANAGTVSLAHGMFYEGNFVLLDHGEHLQTLYMHFSRIDVKTGDHIKKGQRLGLSGATGRVTGPHLHFAVRWQGAYLDPVKLLALQLPTR